MYLYIDKIYTCIYKYNLHMNTDAMLRGNATRAITAEDMYGLERNKVSMICWMYKKETKDTYLYIHSHAHMHTQTQTHRQTHTHTHAISSVFLFS